MGPAHCYVGVWVHLPYEPGKAQGAAAVCSKAGKAVQVSLIAGNYFFNRSPGEGEQVQHCHFMAGLPRLRGKAYGRIFLKSLPNMPSTRNVDDVHEFFAANDAVRVEPVT